ncbi:hypothetical protein FB45DRAFT_1135625, partial [Roridomyces roridus]
MADSVTFPGPSTFVAEGPCAPLKTLHSQPKTSKGHTARTANAFLLYRTAFTKNQTVPRDVEIDPKAISIIAGLTWHALPDEERQKWQAEADMKRDTHTCNTPGYACRP